MRLKSLPTALTENGLQQQRAWSREPAGAWRPSLEAPMPGVAPASPSKPERSETRAVVSLGLRANLAQFSLLVGVNALVGGMIGQERTVLPLIARRLFGIGTFTATV